ncbi:hypothetical protein ACE1B6_11975 [Aerosakkonemataceae cyanobacterium BLCC-F154]|uniref:Uncharacterized protein n=1 Tax=Floridaenema fluviatile BLCC-F154 TaxID=3153640 RepID=A0ABV4YAX3_9CYAN
MVSKQGDEVARINHIFLKKTEREENSWYNYTVSIKIWRIYYDFLKNFKKLNLGGELSYEATNSENKLAGISLKMVGFIQFHFIQVYPAI